MTTEGWPRGGEGVANSGATQECLVRRGEQADPAVWIICSPLLTVPSLCHSRAPSPIPPQFRRISGPAGCVSPPLAEVFCDGKVARPRRCWMLAGSGGCAPASLRLGVLRASTRGLHAEVCFAGRHARDSEHAAGSQHRPATTGAMGVGVTGVAHRSIRSVVDVLWRPGFLGLLLPSWPARSRGSWP